MVGRGGRLAVVLVLLELGDEGVAPACCAVRPKLPRAAVVGARGVAGVRRGRGRGRGGGGAVPVRGRVHRGAISCDSPLALHRPARCCRRS